MEKGKKYTRSLGTHIHALFKRYFEGTASDRERRIVDTLKVTETEENNPLVTDEMMEQDRDWVYNKLSRQFGFNTNKKETGIPVRYLFHWGTLTAATLLVTVLAGWWLFAGKWNREAQEYTLVAACVVRGEPGSTEEVSLEDGSKVYLNRGTKVYTRQDGFNERQREVWVEGEAFFEVQKNPSRPFIVHTGNIHTTVLGTSFNVRAEKDHPVEVTVVTGKVNVAHHPESQEGSRSHLDLLPGQQASFDLATEKFTARTVDLDVYFSWKPDKLLFNEVSFAKAIAMLERRYSVNIELKQSALEHCEITGEHEGTDVEEVLRSMQFLFDFEFERAAPGKIIVKGGGC